MQNIVKAVIVVGLLAVCGLALMAALPDSLSSTLGGKEKAAENLGTVEKQNLTQKVTIAGKVVPKRRLALTAPYKGYLRKVYVAVGDQIKVNQPLVSIHENPAATGGLFPIRSPFAGQVMQVMKKEGELVEQGRSLENTILLIDDLDKLFIEASIPEIDVLKIEVGMKAVVRVSAILDRSYEGTVQELALAAKPSQGYSSRQSVEFPVRIEIEDFDEAVKPGMSAILDVTVGEVTDALVLPHEYIEREGRDYFVTLANNERRPVKLGLQNERYSQITEGLQAGDKVKQVDFLARPES